MKGEDVLATIRATLVSVRDKTAEALDLEERAGDLRREINDLVTDTLPDLFRSAEITHLTIKAEGNHPAIEFKLGPYYRASIPASWDETKRETAFTYLEGESAGDLIKSSVTVNLPRDSEKDRARLIRQLDKLGVPYSCSLSVHQGTLTAWLRERTEHGDLVDLEKIGGAVGEVVKMKEVKS